MKPERLAFCFKSGNYTLCVHPNPDHLEGDMAANRFRLLGTIDNAKAPFADFLQEFVSPDEFPNLLLAGG